MNNRLLRVYTGLLFLLLVGCASVPVKRYYVMNYIPEPLTQRKYASPYPFTIRIKKFDIEEAYARPQIVYRKSPFELNYYFYRVWAITPSGMLTDMVEKHLVAMNLVSHIVRRSDDATRPEYELSGTIEAIEEYDNTDTWFAHLAFRLSLVRLSDDKNIYVRRFDSRKQLAKNDPDDVVAELSRIMDYLMDQATHDLDNVLAREYGMTNAAQPDTSSFGVPALQEGLRK